MRLLSSLAEWNDGRKYRKALKLLRDIYPGHEDRAHMFLAEGAEIMQTITFGNGNLIETMEICPAHDEGFLVEVNIKDTAISQQEDLGW